MIESAVPSVEGKDYIHPLADRLARAEQMARDGRGKLVPEADVVRAFNDLMKEIGAPPSMRADEPAMHKFRIHSIEVPVFPALFSAARNGTSCNPGEAVFLFYLLISNDGKLSEQFLDSAAKLARLNSQGSAGGRSFVTGGVEVLGTSAAEILTSYAARHDLNQNFELFSNLIGKLGF